MKQIIIILSLVIGTYAMASQPTSYDAGAFASDFFDADNELRDIVSNNLMKIKTELERNGNVNVDLVADTLSCLGTSSENYGVVGTCALRGAIPKMTADLIVNVNVLNSKSSTFTFSASSQVVHED